MNGTPAKPSALWFALAGVPLVLGGIAAAAIVFLAVREMNGALARFDGPGEGAVELETAGRQTVFLEYRSIRDGELVTVDEDLADRLSVEVTDLGRGSPVPLEATGTTTYDLGGRKGRSVVAFRAPSPGVYRVRVTAPAGSPPFVFTVGNIVAPVLGFVAAILATAAASAVLAVLTALGVHLWRERRGRAASAVGG